MYIIDDIAYADDLCHKYGTDAIRYYCLHEIPYNQDGNYTEDLLIERINSDLANVLGNLVNRTIAMGNKYFNGIVQNKNIEESIDNELKEIVCEASKKVDSAIETVHLASSIDYIFEIFRRSNKYIDETTPWVLAKDEKSKDRLETVIYNLLESIRVGAYLLSPFLPETSEKIFKQLNIDDRSDVFNANNKYSLQKPEPLFMRIEVKNE